MLGKGKKPFRHLCLLSLVCVQQEYKLCVHGRFCFWEIILRALHNKYQRALPLLPSGKRHFFSSSLMPFALRFRSANFQPGLARETHFYAESCCLERCDCCLASSLQTSLNIFTPSSCLLPNRGGSETLKSRSSCRHTIKSFIFPWLSLPGHN